MRISRLDSTRSIKGRMPNSLEMANVFVSGAVGCVVAGYFAEGFGRTSAPVG